MLRKIWRRIKDFFYNANDCCRIIRSRKNEIKKFQDPRRVKIYKEVFLDEKQKQQIDSFFVENYGEKIPHTWHRHYTAYTGKFDVHYFPELLFIPEFERFMNMDKEYVDVFSDKNVLPILAKEADVKMPISFLECIKGNYRINGLVVTKEAAMQTLLNIGEAFLKPSVDSCSGNGCKVVNFVDGVDVISGKQAAQIIEEAGKDFVLQERIQCHKDIAAIYPGSVNTFRIMTYRWKNQLFTCPVIMRIGQGGSYLDNAHAGGMFIGINSDGTLNKTAFTEWKKEFTKHPDTGLEFQGYQIPLFPKVIEAAKRMHDTMPQIGVANWDFTLDREGNPMLLEVNLKGASVWLFEMAHGTGAFGENTADILKWLHFIKKVKPKSRKEYKFGSIV